MEQHVASAKRNALASLVITDQTIKELPPVIECPYELQHIWDWFHELDKTRQNNMGHGPITYVEFNNWAFRMRIDPTSYETKALMEVDKAFLIHSHTRDKK